MNDTALSFQHTKVVEGGKEVSCYTVFDIDNKKQLWTLYDVERLMFKADAAKLDDEGDEKWYIFDEPELNNDNESVHVETPDEIWAVKKKIEVRSVNDGKETVERKATTVNKKGVNETRQYFRTFNAEFGNEIDENDSEKLQFEGYVVVDNRV